MIVIGCYIIGICDMYMSVIGCDRYMIVIGYLSDRYDEKYHKIIPNPKYGFTYIVL